MIAVITGASSGIGKATALLLGQDGRFRVFAGVRRDDRAAALHDAPSTVTPLTMDVTDASSVRQAIETISRHAAEGEEVFLVNNAGIAVYGPLEYVPLDRFIRQFEVSLFGVVSVTQALLPLIRKQGGRIVNMGSMNGRLGIPIIGPYCAAKFGLRSVSDTLRLELATWGIDVVLIEAGVVATPLVTGATEGLRAALGEGLPRQRYGKVYQKMERMAQMFYKLASKPEDVARTVRRILTTRKPRPVYRVGRDAWAAVFMDAFVPVRWRDWMVKRMYGFD